MTKGTLAQSVRAFKKSYPFAPTANLLTKSLE